MKNRNNLIFLASIILVSIVLILVINVVFGQRQNYSADSITIKDVASDILADGTIASQNEANLHFQIGGKLTYLSAKEGDSVIQGQSIANLDTYALQRQLTAALNTYRSTRDTFDQVGANTTNGVAVGQQRFSLEMTTKAGLGGQNEIDVINDTVKRIVDQNQANLDNSVINVELANYALSLSSLTAPFNGIVVHEDVKNAGINITPATSFMVVDPNALVFRAHVNEQDIDYVEVGSQAKVDVDGTSQAYSGVISKIYPEKIVLPTGQKVYSVDITLSDTKGLRYAQTGSVKIASNTSIDTKLVPRWTVLNGQEIWVREGSLIVLKTVTTGKTHGDFIEITSGLTDNDKIIVNPQSVIQDKYQII